MTGLKLAICVAIAVVSHTLPIVTGRVAIAMAGPTPDELHNKTERDPNHPQTLVYLGVVEGKSYFVETERTMIWTSAKAFCESSNLKLASIETQLQADFLNRTLREHTSPGTPPNYYWTSLHESRRPSMLEWDGTNIAPGTSVLKTWRWDTPAFQYCTLLFLQPTTYSMVPDGARCVYNHSVIYQS